mgnify:FL=1
MNSNTRIAKLAAVAVATAYVAGNNVLAAAIKVPDSVPGTVRLTVSVRTGAKVRVIVNDGSNSRTTALNSSVALLADALYTFAFGVQPGWTLNFDFDATTTIDVFQVDYVMGGVV